MGQGALMRLLRRPFRTWGMEVDPFRWLKPPAILYFPSGESDIIQSLSQFHSRILKLEPKQFLHAFTLFEYIKSIDKMNKFI